MTDEGQTPDTTQEAPQAAEGQQQPEQPDILGQVNERLDKLSGDFQQWVQSQQAQQEYDGWEDPGNQYDDFGQQQYQEPQQPEIDPSIAPYVQQQQALQQELMGVREHMYQRDIMELQDEYPDLRTPEVANPVVQLARQITQQARPTRQALEMAYKAIQADKIAEQQAQQAESQPQVAVEGAGAEAPVSQPDMAEQLFGQQTGPRNPVFGIPMKQR